MMLIDKKKVIDALMAEYRECSKDADEMGGEAVLLADGIDSAIDIVRRMPTIDPVKHEHWEPCADGLYQCSGEGCTQKANKYQRLLWDYCPKCGAKMWRATDG